MKFDTKLKKALCCATLLISIFGYGQFSGQAYSTNVGGGTIAGETYSSEISMGLVGRSPRNSNYRFYLGFPAFNLKSATVSIDAISGGTTVFDQVEGTLLRIEEFGNYDTLDIATSNSGSFSFNSVFLGDYLVNIDSDPEKFVATYYGDAFLWEEADVLTLTKDSLVEVNMTAIPPETNGEGKVSGTIDEDFADEDGRIDARRRAAKRKCGLRRKRTGGRSDQNEFELIAYGETNANGEFEFGFLPEGIYRFFVEYPGIPIDESSFVEFEIGEAGVTDDEFVLAAYVTESGIVIELVLGLTDEYFTQFSIYPNPTSDVININYDKILSEKVSMKLIDMNGTTLMSRRISQSNNEELQVDLKPLKDGHYILIFADEETGKYPVTFRIIKRE